MEASRNSFRLLELVPSGMLTLAHTLSGLALLTFGARADGYPLHPTGLAIYLAMVVLSLAALAIQFRRTPSERTTAGDLLLVSAPAYASLVFLAAIWIVGAPYAPYDPADSDIVWFFSVFLAVVLSLISIVYGSIIYLLVACVTQTVLYSATLVLPYWVRYSSAGVLGFRPASEFLTMAGIYALSALLLVMRNWFGGSSRPNLWFATAFANLAGAGVLYLVLSWLPPNGSQLEYISSTAVVPERVWDWSHSAALSTAHITMVSAFLVGIVALIRNEKMQRLNTS